MVAADDTAPVDGGEPVLPRLAEETSRRHEMFPPAAPVLIMVSGGADSVSLLRLMAAGGIAPGSPLEVLHVDHALRPDSRLDGEFVSALSEGLGITCKVVRYDVGAYARRERLNVEDAGRRVRYRFAEEALDALCDSHGVARQRGRIAVAHTLDDRVETMLIRLITGSGMGPLSGVRPVRGRIVRPLVGVRRSQVVEYLDRLGQSWREDPTNRDIGRLRARIRHDVVPLLEAVNPRFVRSAERTASILAEEDALLSEMAEAFARDFAQFGDGEVRFDRSLMLTLTRPVARRTVRAALAEALPETSRLPFEHVEAVVEGMADEAFARDLPEGLRAFNEYGTMVVSRGGERSRPLAPTLLDVPGAVALPDGTAIVAEETTVGELSEDANMAFVDADSITGPLVVDSPHRGDRMRPLGMEGTKKLSDLLTEKKVPRRKRSSVPVVRDGDEIVWVAGVRLSEDHKVRPRTRRVLKLELLEEGRP